MAPGKKRAGETVHTLRSPFIVAGKNEVNTPRERERGRKNGHKGGNRTGAAAGADTAAAVVGSSVLRWLSAPIPISEIAARINIERGRQAEKSTRKERRKAGEEGSPHASRAPSLWRP